MKATINYKNGTVKKFKLSDSNPITPRVIVCKDTSTVHQLTRSGNCYEYDEVSFGIIDNGTLKLKGIQS